MIRRPFRRFQQNENISTISRAKQLCFATAGSAEEEEEEGEESENENEI